MEPKSESMTDAEAERLSTILGNVLLQSMNEGLVLAQLEGFKYFNPMPANIALEKGSATYKRLDRLSSSLGGPRTLLLRENETPPPFDNYIEDAIAEIVHCFHRARMSVSRAHLYFIGSSLIAQNPEYMHLSDDETVRRSIISTARGTFWEHTETSYIRLASHWDRLGQLLDFIFFNIRQYERDGFPAVLDRIRTNTIPVHASIGSSLKWKGIRAFQTSESPDGLKWLLRRRNLLIHSLHLAPRSENSSEPLFAYTYNHLEESVREKLRPGSMQQELDQLHVQLNKAANLFDDVLDLALMGVELRANERGSA